MRMVGMDGMLGWIDGLDDRMERSRRDCSISDPRSLARRSFPKRELHVADEKINGRAYFFFSFPSVVPLSSPSPSTLPPCLRPLRPLRPRFACPLSLARERRRNSTSTLTRNPPPIYLAPVLAALAAPEALSLHHNAHHNVDPLSPTPCRTPPPLQSPMPSRE